jgi:hypothetical protein
MMKYQITFLFSLFSTFFAMGASNILHVCYHTNGILSKATVGEKPGARTEIHWDSTGQMSSYAEIVGSNHYGNDYRIWMSWYPNGVKAQEVLPGIGGSPIIRSWYSNGQMEKEEATTHDGFPITRSWYSNSQMEKEEVVRPDGFSTLRTWSEEGKNLIDGILKKGSPWEGIFVQGYSPVSGSNIQVSVAYQGGLLNGVNLGNGCVEVRKWCFKEENDESYQVRGAFLDYIANPNDCTLRIIGNSTPSSEAVNASSLKMLDDLQIHQLPLKNISTNDLNYLSFYFNYEPLKKFQSNLKK